MARARACALPRTRAPARPIRLTILRLTRCAPVFQVGFILTILLRGSSDGVLVPIPQYPLYSATLALQEAQLLPYELNEATGWAMPIEVRCTQGAKRKGAGGARDRMRERLARRCPARPRSRKIV